jgi:hypothetical protein
MTNNTDKTFTINAEQLNQILNTLAEFPAKSVIGSIDILRSLKPAEPVEEKEINRKR